MKKIRRVAPLFVTLFIVLADQISKAWVVKTIPVDTLYRSYFNDFLWIVHVRNTGAAFSMAADSSAVTRIVFLLIGCIALMVFIAYLILSKKQNIVTETQRWFCAGILGGGIGTIIDRIFRFDSGVVDFISIKTYGIFGMERFATFNIADSCVVCFVIAFVIAELVNAAREKKNKEKK